MQTARWRMLIYIMATKGVQAVWRHAARAWMLDIFTTIMAAEHVRRRDWYDLLFLPQRIRIRIKKILLSMMYDTPVRHFGKETWNYPMLNQNKVLNIPSLRQLSITSISWEGNFKHETMLVNGVPGIDMVLWILLWSTYHYSFPLLLWMNYHNPYLTNNYMCKCKWLTELHQSNSQEIYHSMGHGTSQVLGRWSTIDVLVEGLDSVKVQTGKNSHL